MTASQAEFKLSRADMVEQMDLRLHGNILVPKVANFDPATVTLENLVTLLRNEAPGEDISRGVIYTDDWHYKDRRVRNHNNVFISWPSEEADTVLHKQLQGTEEDGAFIVEDLGRAALGGGVKYFPPKTDPKAANDNKPSQPAPAERPTRPALSHDEERELLERFQREQLLPGERGKLVFDDNIWRACSTGAFWHITEAVVEGFAGDVFIGPLDHAPKFRAENGTLEIITPLAPFPLVDPSEWRGVVATVREWFITGLIPHRQVTLLSGDGGVGKSLLGLQIGAASALAIDTLGLQPSPGRVLYLGAEDEAEEFHRRLEDICAAHHREIGDLADLRILPLADQDALLSVPDSKGIMESTSLWRRVDRFVKEWKPRLVVLDTAADLYGGDEVKRSQVRHFVAMLRKMAIARDCAVLLLAHPSIAGMASGSGYSGSTAWNNSVRSRLYLTSGEGDVRILRTVKSNYGKIGDEMQLEWCEGAFVLHDPSKPGIADGLLNSRADSVFVSVLSKLNRTGQRPSPNKSPSYAPRMMQKHPDAKGTKMRDLEMAMQRLLDAGTIKIVQEGPPSRRFSRLIVSAEDFGGVDDG
ncbi:AAA family ATPase [Bradyrhizobium sp. 61]|uniref:AAA family ATPase n=1 Tax=unclassified Bradyrhizobium TaxID=2631580 RepID=UPI001FF6FF63|nr:AAA family ATPase [Bradyrhizobium sp. 61]MCK1279474.1 AAA family ATPase [Bradyrhizobium sp. 61]